MKKILIIAICLLVAGCSVKRPVLYPNAKLQKVGQAQAQMDIDVCCRMAEAYLTSHPGKEIAADAAKTGVVGAATGARSARCTAAREEALLQARPQEWWEALPTACSGRASQARHS